MTAEHSPLPISRHFSAPRTFIIKTFSITAPFLRTSSHCCVFLYITIYLCPAPSFAFLFQCHSAFSMSLRGFNMSLLSLHHIGFPAAVTAAFCSLYSTFQTSLLRFASLKGTPPSLIHKYSFRGQRMNLQHPLCLYNPPPAHLPPSYIFSLQRLHS